MLSACYVSCIYSNSLKTSFYHESKYYEPKEQSDLGPYCLQYRLPVQKMQKTKKKIHRKQEQAMAGHLQIVRKAARSSAISEKIFCFLCGRKSKYIR